MDEASVVDSPILRDILGIDNFTTVYEFSLEKARKELSGWKDSNNNGTLDKKFSKSDKDSTELEITLYASDLAELEKIANILKQQWEAIGGVNVNVEIQDRKELRQKVIKTREFDALLFGSLLYMDPDQFSYWHSSQKRDPGLNLSMYDNPDVDKLLDDARQTLDYKERIKKYDAFQQIIVEDVPAIFLFNPHYLYVVGGQIKGVNVKKIAISSKRFTGIEKWHIKTRRQLKSE
jgi:peptide/nickel transport system substrate-binding protein